MILFFKKIIFKILPQNVYLKVLHFAFFILYDLNLLKNKREYEYHYFVKKIIKEGDCVVDLGANLGYFSRIFCRLIGKHGQLICIEPMPPFFSILNWKLGKKNNVILHNCALGDENKLTTIQQPIEKDGYFRTGLANISNIPVENYANVDKDYISYNIEMKKGSDILKDLSKIDYIKVDIEGYEEFVLPEIKPIIEKYTPVLHVETWGSHKVVVFKLMQDLGYNRYVLSKHNLQKDNDPNSDLCDYLFIHNSKESQYYKG